MKKITTKEFYYWTRRMNQDRAIDTVWKGMLASSCHLTWRDEHKERENQFEKLSQIVSFHYGDVVFDIGFSHQGEMGCHSTMYTWWTNVVEGLEKRGVFEIVYE